MDSQSRQGFEAVLLPVDRWARVDPAQLDHALGQGAALVSIQHSNHEVGTLQPLEEIAAITHRHGVPLHVDAIAAGGLMPLSPRQLGIDLLSLSGSRIGGVPGAGALWVREGLRLLPLIEGGVQEGGLRGGGENLLGIVAMAAAAQAVTGRELVRAAHVRRLRDRLQEGLRASGDGLQINGPDREGRLPGHLHLSIAGCEGESLVHRLHREGLDASTGSSCTSEAGKPSHVLQAMGLEPQAAQCSVLFSLGAASTEQETSAAFGSVISWFPWVLAIAVLLFAFSTIISWGYYCEKIWTFVLGESRVIVIGYRILFVILIVPGAVMTVDQVIDFMDAVFFLMAVPNIVGLYFLAPELKRDLKSYLARVESGEIEDVSAVPQPAE